MPRHSSPANMFSRSWQIGAARRPVRVILSVEDGTRHLAARRNGGRALCPTSDGTGHCGRTTPKRAPMRTVLSLCGTALSVQANGSLRHRCQTERADHGAILPTTGRSRPPTTADDDRASRPGGGTTRWGAPATPAPRSGAGCRPGRAVRRGNHARLLIVAPPKRPSSAMAIGG